jgi:hypothetical protein
METMTEVFYSCRICDADVEHPDEGCFCGEKDYERHECEYEVRQVSTVHLLGQIACLFASAEQYGLHCEAIGTLVDALCPELTEEQLASAINRAVREWDL